MASKPAFAQSAQVDHPKFGLGSVLSCNEEYIVIKFDDHGEKKFVLSIVLPNRNHAHYLPRALDALRTQTWQNLEIVVVDDRSSDESRDVLARYAALDSRIRFIALEQHGGIAVGALVGDRPDSGGVRRLRRQRPQRPRVGTGGHDGGEAPRPQWPRARAEASS